MELMKLAVGGGAARRATGKLYTVDTVNCIHEIQIPVHKTMIEVPQIRPFARSML